MSQTNVNVPGDSGEGMGAGMIVGLILAVIIIAFVVWWFLLNGGGGGTPADSTGGGGVQSLVPSVLQSIVPTGS